jgi:hypothetical protein
MLEKAEMKRGDEEMGEKSGAAGKCRLGTNVGKVGRWQGWKASLPMADDIWSRRRDEDIN